MPAANKESRFYKMIDQFKAYIITEELRKFDGNVCKTAESFGLHRNSLTRLIHDLQVESFSKRKRKDSLHVLPDRAKSGEGSVPIDSGVADGVQVNASGESGDVS